MADGLSCSTLPRSFPLNCWYMAAWASEVKDRPFARRLFGCPIVMARLVDGIAVAFDDRCPHRFAPLSLGKVNGDRLECGYHGLQFDRTGTCVANPGGKGEFPPGTRTRAYPLVERHRILWIWPGDPALADQALIPPLHHIPPAGGVDNIGNYLHVKANWLLEIDNIMDLTHVAYLHDGSLGNQTMRSAEIEVSEANGQVRAVLWMPDTLAGFGPLQGQPCDQWNNVVWMAPSVMMMDFGAVPRGSEPVQDPGAYAFHIFTPESERTSHYFFGSSGSYGEEDAAFVELVRSSQNAVFLAEDNPMVEGIQERMERQDFWALKPAILPSDAAAIRVRRRIAQMCRREQQA